MRLWVWVGVLGALAAPAWAEVEEGAAKVKPWSGYWWPSQKGELVKPRDDENPSPLAKFDKVKSTKAEAWERKAHANPDLPKWHGRCHAWAAAAMIEPEPKRPVTIDGVRFTVRDIKALLTLSHDDDEPTVFGERFDGGSSDPQDLTPEALWSLCREYIGEKGQSILMDLDNSREVWTYPVYAYNVEFNPSEDGKDLYEGKITLTAANMLNARATLDYVGTLDLVRTYWFTVKITNGEMVAGSSRWVGESRRHHPDFAWFPKARRAENPDLDYALIRKLVEESADPDDPRLSATPLPLRTDPETP